MTVFRDISAALDDHLNSMVGLPDVAWENAAYEPTHGELYLRPTLLPAETYGATMGVSGTDEHQGIYQVDIFSSLGAGKFQAIGMADTIADRFKPATELTYNSRLIRIIRVSRRAGIDLNDAWYQLPVDIYYLTHTTKR